ncbi:cytochrome P450 [Nemania sp. FL0031]|nr:cytochrome P450 [Nemania sp. FL0031]
MASLLSLIVGAAVPVLLYWYYRRSTTPPSQIPGISQVDIDGVKSPARYVTETGRLIEQGYNDYCKRGFPFSIPNLWEPTSPLVVLPMKYLDEVSYASQSKLSAQEYVSKLGLVQYSCGPPMVEEVQHVAKTNLNRALEWTPIMPYMSLMSIFARMGARMLVGSELCTAWALLSSEYLLALMKATRSVRTGYHPSLRWAAKYIDKDVKVVRKIRGRAAKLLHSILQERSAAMKSDTMVKHHDAIQWLIEEHTARGNNRLSSDELAQNLFVMTVASTHQTTMIALWLLFDLIDHPESLAEIKSEITKVQGGKDQVWTRKKLGELRVMDSFMTETIRIHSSMQTTVNRVVMKPWVFKDGLKLPVGTQISFPTYQYTLDAEVHQSPSAFDPKRHLRKRQEIDAAKFHFASTADSLVWGSGSHACPGRFMVQDSLKLIFIHLLMHYEFKYPDQGKLRPDPDTPTGIMIAPDMTMSVLFKKTG